jgi:tRNA threonylcarbamoyladenosine biosynthesis protein TsaB
MSFILSIDTATENATVCFAKNSEVLCSATNENQKDHAGFLQTAIKNLAEQHQFDLHTLDAVAVTEGPGSYTGLRVGMASAKGLCYALNKPLIALSTLQLLALAATHASSFNHTQLICPMIDARRMEVFTAVYSSEIKAILHPAPMVLTENSFENYLQNQQILFVGSGVAKWRAICDNTNAIFLSEKVKPSTIATLAYQLYENHQFINLAYSQPNYLKSFVDNNIK